MAAPPASDKEAAGSEEKRPTSPARGGSLCAIGLVLTAVVAVAVAVTISLLVRFHGHPMSQVWILSLSICLDVFFFLLFICRTRSFWTDLVRLSYGPLLAFFSDSAIGSATATFILLFSTVWAAGNVGYSLAVRDRAKPVIYALPSPSCPTKESVKELNFDPYIGAPFAVIWTLVMVFIVNVTTMTDEMDILMTLSYFGWIHVAIWLIFVALAPMQEFPVGEQMEWAAPTLVLWMGFSPVIYLVSQLLSVVLHLQLMMVLVGSLCYNLAIYRHFLATAAPSTTTRGNEHTLHSENLEDKIGQVKSDPRLGEMPN